LSGNSISSASLEAISTLTHLRNLDLSENRITELPTPFYNLVNLEKLNLKVNKITTLNVELYKLNKLVELNLTRNELQSLPHTIGELKQLKYLFLADNSIKTLPHEIGYLYESLRKVALTNNKLSDVPGEFGWINPSIEFDLTGNPLKTPFITWLQEGPIQFLQNLAPYTQAYHTTSYAEGENKNNGQLGAGKSFTVKAADYKGNLRVTGGDAFKARFISPSGKEVDVVVKDLKDGSYTVFYNLREAGPYEVSISLRGGEIKDSPWILNIA